MVNSVPTDPTVHLMSLAMARPSSVALLAPARAAMTFSELARRIGRIGTQLATWGIGRGDVASLRTRGRVAAGYY